MPLATISTIATFFPILFSYILYCYLNKKNPGYHGYHGYPVYSPPLSRKREEEGCRSLIPHLALAAFFAISTRLALVSFSAPKISYDIAFS